MEQEVGTVADLKPCPFCGSDFLVLHVDRLHGSSISCACGASMTCAECSDQLTGELADALVSMWNRRADDAVQ